MGDLYGWLQARAEHLRDQQYKNQKVAKYLDDEEAGEALYEDGLAFGTAYPVDEKRIVDKFKKATTMLELLARKKSEEDKKRG